MWSKVNLNIKYGSKMCFCFKAYKKLFINLSTSTPKSLELGVFNTLGCLREEQTIYLFITVIVSLLRPPDSHRPTLHWTEPTALILRYYTLICVDIHKIQRLFYLYFQLQLELIICQTGCHIFGVLSELLSSSTELCRARVLCVY